MAFKRRKRIDDTFGDVSRAFEADETAPVLHARHRHYFMTALPGVIAIFLLNSRLFNGLTNQVVIWIFRALVVVGLILVLKGMGGYLWLRWTERVLRSSPWVYWTARVGPVKLFNRQYGYAVALFHPEWDGRPVVRLLIPGPRNTELGDGSLTDVWAAGSPLASMMVSPIGGAMPMYARRPLLPKSGRRWLAAASAGPSGNEEISGSGEDDRQ